MSVSSSGSYNPRIYGKRSGMKRKQVDQPSEPVAQDDTTSLHSVAVRKRRKVSVEPFVRTPSPAKTRENVGTDPEGSPQMKPKVVVTYGSPSKRDSSPLATLSPSPGKPSKSARDLSKIFDSIVPSSTPPPSPSKLAKRMLARSKTESSIGSQTSTHDNSLERTPSLPNLPSSPSNRSDTHTTPSAAVVPPLVPNLKPNMTKTYAGSFRSFLVPLPAASSSNSLSQGIESWDDEFDSRESYSSLRSRWGVDNSEDDPHPNVSPQSTSNSATPTGSPSKGRPKVSFGASGIMNPLKSISELRNKGESRRFLDEIGYLFEGMDKSGGIGLRRASALQITTKLCDAEFVRKAKAVDFFSRTWDAFLDAGAGKGEDNILDVILVFFAALAARDASILSDLAQRSSSWKEEDIQEGRSLFVDSLFHLLGIVITKSDPLLLASSKSDIESDLIRKAGINKKDFETVKTIHQTIFSKSHLFSLDGQISTPLLIMYSLHSLSPSDIPMSHLPTLLASLRLSLELASPGTPLISALQLQWRDAADAINYENIYYHLQLLETYLSNQWESPRSEAGGEDWREINENVIENARDEWLVDDLIALGVCTELGLQSQEDPKLTAVVQKCLECTLRVLVNLTHADELWGRKVVQCKYAMNFLLRTIHSASQNMVQGRGDMVNTKVKEEEEQDLDDRNDRSVEREETRALDTLCLALGLLTNLVQVVKEAKKAVRETCLNPSCTLQKRACARRCTCSPASNGLDILVNIYIIQGFKAESSESVFPADTTEALIEADASFLRGHLAVLFGLLMSESPENQSAILESLPTPTTSRAQKNKANNKVKLSRLAEQARDFVAFYAVVNRHSEEGEKESKVAKSVVRFLERQRDAAL